MRALRTMIQLKSGRVVLGCQDAVANPGRHVCLSYASDDEGKTWKEIAPGKIEASGAPGQLRRLQSGRLVLFWNRFIDKAKRTGRREQLSMAFSEDDGRTWTDPVVVAYDPKKPRTSSRHHRLSYPYVYEHVPGELWVTTMQGPLGSSSSKTTSCPAG